MYHDVIFTKLRVFNIKLSTYLLIKTQQYTLQARTLLRDALKYKLITHSVELTTDHVERANKRPVPIYASTTQKPRKYVRYSQ